MRWWSREPGEISVDERRHKGARGGIRIIYYWTDEQGQFILFTIYDKDQRDDLTKQQRDALATALNVIKKGLDMTECDIFSELMTGMQELKDHQEGKITLKRDKVTKRAPVTIAPQELRDVREKLNLSQAVFAHYLHTGETTWQNWEQGRARPNAQAVLLIRMVQQNPETLKTLAQL